MDSFPVASPAPTNRNWTRFWWSIAIALFGLFLARAIEARRDDFLAYYAAAERALAGISPYRAEETPYRYLPVTAYFFAPFTLFGVVVARVVFFVANFAAASAIYVGLRRRLGDLATALLLALFFRFHNHDFGNSQINPILLLLFFYWWRTRETNLAFSALAFSVFGSFKIVPFAIGLPLLLRGRWREISWIAILTVVLNFLPVFFYHDGPFVFRDWFLKAKEIDDPVMLPNVQSIQAAAWWILDGHFPLETFKIAMRIGQAALFTFVLLSAPRKNREAWMIAGTLAITVLTSPLAWKHNYLQFLPLVALWFAEDPRFVERRTRILYGIAMVGLVLLPTAVGAWNRGFADRLYFMPWTGLILVVLGPLLARRAETEI